MDEHCDDSGGTQVQRVELHFPSGIAVGTAYLVVRLSNARSIELKLAPRTARILLMLYEAKLDDVNGEPRSARGWRTKENIAAEIDRLTGYPPSEETVTSYLSRFTRSLDRKLQPAGGAASKFHLIERRRGDGARVAPGVEMDVIANRPRPSSSREDDSEDR